MVRVFGEWVAGAGRVGFLALLPWAAANYGLTRPGSAEPFQVAVAVAFALWLAGSVLAWHAPRVGWFAWLAAVGVLGFGWSVALLGEWIDPLLFSDDESKEWLLDLALMMGTDYPALARETMMTTTALVGCFLVAVDCWARRAWARALLLVLAATAAGMILLFLLQRLVGQPFTLYSIDGRQPLSFATYRYWGNGAAFLNLMWPLFFGAAIHAVFARSLWWAAWAGAGLVALAATFFNISKAGNVLAFAGVGIFAAVALLPAIRSLRAARIRVPALAVVLALVPVAGVLASSYFLVPWERWDRFQERSLNPVLEAIETTQETGEAFDTRVETRLHAFTFFWGIVPEAGWAGFGPGSFGLVYWERIDPNDRIMRRTPFWVAHQDYLQTLIEWGYAGTALWGILIGVGAARLLVGALAGICHRRHRPERPLYFDPKAAFDSWVSTLPAGDSPFLRAAGFAAVVMTGLHALVDFPMQIPSLQLYFLCWIALGWSKPRRRAAAMGESGDPDAGHSQSDEGAGYCRRE